MNQKNPGLSAILSFFIPGLGQIYNGQLGKGLAIAMVAIISWMLVHMVIGLIILIPLWIWSIYDAHETAERSNP